jgi:DNA-binding CsgD family transcriptional regulator
MDRPASELDGPLEELVQNAFLYPFEYVDRGYFDFRHQLLRDALYESVPAVQLRRLHARAGEFGAELVGASEIHASMHFERAGMREEAFRAALRSARMAAKLSSHREAFELYSRAHRNMPADLPPRERAEVVQAYSDEAMSIEENDLAERLAREARELFLQAGRAVDAVRAELTIGSCWRREGHPLSARIAQAREMIAELEAIPPASDRDEHMSAAYGFLGWAYMDALRLDDARDAMRTAVAIAEGLGLEAEVLQESTGLGMLDVIEGRVDGGLAAIRAAADESRAKGYESCGVTAYKDAALMAVRSMEYRGAANQMSDARRYADEIEQSHCARVMASTDAVLAWATGDWTGATRIGEQALADHGRGRAGAIAHWGLGFVAAGRGDTEAAATHLAAALEFGERADWLEMALPSRWGLAENTLLSGDPDGAIHQCEVALEAARLRGERSLLAPFVVTGVRAYVAAGRPEGAQGWLDRISAAIGPESTVAGAAIDHGRGLVRLATGSVSAAREALEAAVVGWDGKGRTWEALWARLDLAGAMLRSNRYVDATRLVSDVRDAARRMESPPLLARADELERLARGRGAEADAWHPLTVREFEVARQIAAGMTNAEIAAELFVSPKTVSAHVEHILAKLGAGRRAEIATWVASVAQPVA